MFSADNLSKAIIYLLMLFAVALLVSIAAGNVVLGLVTLCWLVFVVFKWRREKDHGFQQLVSKPITRDYLYVIAVWIGALLLSGLCCGHPLDGLKVWADWCVWRFMPFVILATIPFDDKHSKRLLLTIFVGLTVMVNMVMIYQGLTTGGRADGWNGTAMTAAGELCILLPAMLIAYYDDKVFGKYSKYFSGLFLIGLGGLVVNNTRGAWIGVGVACAVVVCQYALRSKKQLMILGVVLCLLGGLFVVKPSLLKRWTLDPNSYSTISRIHMWTSAYNMWKDHPVLGVGLSQYEFNYQQKYVLEAASPRERKHKHAHSNIMQMLAENGIVGLATFLLCFGYVLIRSWRDWCKTKNPYALMIFTGTLALMIQGLTERNIGNSVVMKLYWLFLGICLTLCEERKEFY